MGRLRLERPRNNFGYKAFWRDCEPFVMNDRGLLIHRPRTVVVCQLSGFPSHIGVGYYCGNQASGGRNFTFLGEPPEDRLVCAVCEARAVMAGLPSTDEIMGRHVCKGRVKAVRDCCEEGSQ